MGLLSNRVGKEVLKPGDHIYSWRTAYVYAHHGIYVGNNKVIHFTRGQGQEVGTGTALDLLLTSSGPSCPCVPCTSCSNQQYKADGVLRSCLKCFLSGGVLYRFEYSVNPALFIAKARGGTCTLAVSDLDEKVVHRATHLFNNGFRCYNVFKNNCEDFAIYCKTGLLVVEHGVVGQSGQAISIIGGPMAAVFSTPIRLLTTNVYGMTVTAVGVYCASRYLADISNRRDVVKVAVEDLTSTLGVPPSTIFQPLLSINKHHYLYHPLVHHLTTSNLSSSPSHSCVFSSICSIKGNIQEPFSSEAVLEMLAPS